MRFVVEPSCLLGLVTSAIEVYPNETTGLLAGRVARRLARGRTRPCVVLAAAQPVQTARRARNGVVPNGNKAAYARARNSISALGFRLVGGYHSHPDWPARLSKSDLEWCKEEIKDLEQMDLFPHRAHWLEVIVKLEKRSYRRSKGRQLTLWETGPALEGQVRIDDGTGFHLTVRGHYLNAETFARVPFSLTYDQA